jgi:hypothetical protein
MIFSIVAYIVGSCLMSAWWLYSLIVHNNMFKNNTVEALLLAFISVLFWFIYLPIVIIRRLKSTQYKK